MYPIFNEDEMKYVLNNHEDVPYYTEEHMDAALCIWEYCMFRRIRNDESVFDWLRGGEGAAAARDMCIRLAKDCEKSYQIANHLGFDDSFDWEFVPAWVELAMHITHQHDLAPEWVDFMGRKIYYDWKDALQHY